MSFCALVLGLLFLFPLAASDNQQLAAKSKTPPSNPPAAPPAPRAGLNRAAAARNENVPVNRIDNEALKDAHIRLGDNVTLLPQPLVEFGYYAAEHGRAPADTVPLRPLAPVSGWHGELFALHQNSVFNARTFFQVGPVLPSRQNFYGGRFSGPAPRLGWLTGSLSQRKVRGMVNGNVLAPLASERTPLASDPAVRALVARFLGAYPDAPPNRPDFDPRALNTNSPQIIDDIDASLRLDRQTGSKGRFTLSDSLGRQRIRAFQFVAGQNPDTEIHSHRARLSYTRAVSEKTEMAAGAAFARMTSLLVPEPHAVGPRIRIGYQIEELGPDSHFPIDRALNAWRLGTLWSRRAGTGRHALTWGGELTRTQLNGIETNNARGLFWFTNNFGRTAIENLRMGTPTTYEVTVGPMARGFRNWGATLFAADQWRATTRLQLYYGLRYSLESTPREVNGLNQVPYGCDCNNISPRFSIALRLPGQWVMRAGYTVSFGQIPPVTYQQVRYNLPLARYIQVQNPDLLAPLRDIDLGDPHGRSSPTVLSSDLVSPYSHQYTYSLERRFGGVQGYLLRLGYIGSRSFKLLDSYQENRAVALSGVPPTTQNVDLRRPDPRYYDIKYIVNAGVAYLDAAQVSVEAPYRRGLAWGATYTFGKALDIGSDYSGTAANRDLTKGRSQSQFDTFADKKGLSTFDSTHALLFYYAYDLPKPAGLGGTWRWLAEGWQVSGSLLAKTGTPLTLYIGSDAPGFGNVDGGPGDRPHIVDPGILGRTIGDPDTAPQILRRDRFHYLTPGETRGSLGRNTFRKGGIANLNAAISKQWRARDRTVLLRGEAINLANHPQFDEPQRNLSSPAFGKITNTLNDGRVLQLGVRLIL